MSRSLIIAATIAIVAIAGAYATVVAGGINAPADERQVLVTDEFVTALNARPGMTWKASADNGKRINGASVADIKMLLGVKEVDSTKKLPARLFGDAERLRDIPASFESAAQWPSCPSITKIRDQSACGSCWAIAAAEAITDRYCTSGGPTNLPISTANLMSCCWYCGNGCQGGQPSLAWDYWVSTGLVAESCQPYPFPTCQHHNSGGDLPPCPSAIYPTPACNSNGCSQGASGNSTKYFGQTAYSVRGEEAYQRELMAHGPIEVSFSVYADFPAYKSGVYTRQSNQYLGGHAVRLVGWGELNGVKYWKIANSWNKFWGQDGYFLIARGNNECGIESSGVAGLPKLA